MEEKTVWGGIEWFLAANKELDHYEKAVKKRGQLSKSVKALQSQVSSLEKSLEAYTRYSIQDEVGVATKAEIKQYFKEQKKYLASEEEKR